MSYQRCMTRLGLADRVRGGAGWTVKCTEEQVTVAVGERNRLFPLLRTCHLLLGSSNHKGREVHPENLRSLCKLSLDGLIYTEIDTILLSHGRVLLYRLYWMYGVCAHKE